MYTNWDTERVSVKNVKAFNIDTHGEYLKLKDEKWTPDTNDMNKQIDELFSNFKDLRRCNLEELCFVFKSYNRLKYYNLYRFLRKEWTRFNSILYENDTTESWSEFIKGRIQFNGHVDEIKKFKTKEEVFSVLLKEMYRFIESDTTYAKEFILHSCVRFNKKYL